MKIAIRYYTKSGNTKKLAEAISKELNIKAEDISHSLNENVDILFLGSSIYAGGIAKEVKDFINNINVNVKTVINFSTAAILNGTRKGVAKYCAKKGINVSEDEFFCKGSFGLLNKDRPNKNDLDNIAKFARKIINGSNYEQNR